MLLQAVLVQEVNDLQPECRDLITTVGDFDQLALEEIDV